MDTYKNYALVRSFLSVKERKNLIAYFESQQPIKYRVGSSDDPSGEVIQDYIDLSVMSEWEDLYQRAINVVDTVNQWHWNFVLDEYDQPLRIARYGVGFKHDWHVDYCEGAQSKVAFSCLLNDAFTGGELQMLETPPFKVKAGQAVVFPGYHGHRVTPVTMGIRYVLLGWFTGPRFR